MTAGRRAVALGGLSLLLGGIAASDMQAREAQLARQTGPGVAVLVTRDTVPAGAQLTAARLSVRHVPQRYAPQTAFRALAEVAGARAGVRIPGGTDLEPALLAQPGTGSPSAAGALRAGERIARIVVVGDPVELAAGARIDVLVTADRPNAATHVALAGAEVLASRGAPAPAGADGAAATLPHASLALRVTLQQALLLTAAQNTAREIRALAQPVRFSDP